MAYHDTKREEAKTKRLSRTITSVKSHTYSHPKKESIDCIVTCDEVPGEHPFTARADDPEEHGRILFAELTSGLHGVVAPYSKKNNETFFIPISFTLGASAIFALS